MPVHILIMHWSANATGVDVWSKHFHQIGLFPNFKDHPSFVTFMPTFNVKPQFIFLTKYNLLLSEKKWIWMSHRVHIIETSPVVDFLILDWWWYIFSLILHMNRFQLIGFAYTMLATFYVLYRDVYQRKIQPRSYYGRGHHPLIRLIN